MIHKLTLTTYFITSFIKSFCVSSQEIVIPLPDSIFLYKILPRYSQIVVLPKIGIFIYHKRSGFMAGYILELREKKTA